MKATRKQIKAANEIAARFSGWHEPHEIAAMYDELEKIGVSTGCITNRQDFPNLGCWQGHCEWVHKRRGSGKQRFCVLRL